MFGGSIRVARIRGISIELHPSWLIILALVTFTLANGVFPDQYENWSTATYWVVGTIASVLLFATVLIHELAHALVAQRRGIAVPSITLFIFGGVSSLEEQPRSAGEEFMIAAAGPLTSLVIAALTLGLWFAFEDVNQQARAVLGYLATVNLLLAVFNILPGFPLDGGRVLRSIAWNRTKSFRRATRIAGGVGELFGYGLMAIGVFLLLGGLALNGLWLMFIGWFLLGAARAETSRLKLDTILAGLRARNVMREDFPQVRPGTSLQEVADDFMVGHGERAVVVALGGSVSGIITVNDIRHVAREAWPQTPAQQAMTPREKIITVDVETPALDILHLLAEKGLNQVPVLEDGRMVGLVTRRELLERVQLAESLAPDELPEPPSEEQRHHPQP
ncbi:MAG: site-2 protease family protein [Dehalococcoidia bacterium]|nr:site-2 protease family protein [Dehalococcoidia bacterium]